MSMFDRVIVEYPLPDAGAAAVKQWQTKDLNCGMDNYKITASGRLLEERVHYEDRSDPNAKKGSFGSIAGCMTPVHEAWADMNYHGVLNFYGDANTGQLRRISMKPETFGVDMNHPEETEWFEYNAKFTDGSLVEIKRVVEE